MGVPTLVRGLSVCCCVRLLVGDDVADEHECDADGEPCAEYPPLECHGRVREVGEIAQQGARRARDEELTDIAPVAGEELLRLVKSGDRVADEHRQHCTYGDAGRTDE